MKYPKVLAAVALCSALSACASGQATQDQLADQFASQYGLEVVTVWQDDGGVTMSVLAGCKATVTFDGTQAVVTNVAGYPGFVVLDEADAVEDLTKMCGHSADFGPA